MWEEGAGGGGDGGPGQHKEGRAPSARVTSSAFALA